MAFRFYRIVSLLLFLIPSISAAPLDSSVSNTTSIEFVSFVSDPSGRGTLSLIISCLLTLVLCVWSALHLNVPPQSRTRIKEFWTYVAWILAGVYAPEMVVFAAWRQFNSARLLSKAVQDTYKAKADGEKATDEQFRWTLTHSFFACAGGFAIDCTPFIEKKNAQASDSCFLPPNAASKLTLTSRGLAFMAKCGIVPEVPKADIEDKSKANHLAKTLVMIQAIWMLLQVVGRAAAKLPITLLEVNTVAHVLCALTMYTMWWYKPLSPKEPILLQGDWVAQLLPFMYSTSDVSGKVDRKHLQSHTVVKTLFASMHLFTKTPELEMLCCRFEIPLNSSLLSPGRSTDFLVDDSRLREDSEALLQAPEAFILPEDSADVHCVSNKPECKALLDSRRKEKETATAFFERRPRIRMERTDTSALQSSMNRRAALSQTLDPTYAYRPIITTHVLFQHVLSLPQSPGSGSEAPSRTARACICTHFRPAPLVTDYSRNWPSDALLRDVNGLLVGMILWTANLLYGGIHALAWNAHFPSSAEKWLWRASASYIGFCGGLWVALNWIVSGAPRLNEFWERWMDGEKTWLESVSLGLVVFVCGFSLTLARAYIVVEAFLSIRSLPRGAYETPTWTQIFPHF